MEFKLRETSNDNKKQTITEAVFSWQFLLMFCLNLCGFFYSMHMIAFYKTLA